MAEEDSSLGSPHSLRSKLRSTLCFSCCFPHHRVRPRIIARSNSLHNSSSNTKSHRSSDLPHHLKDKCSNFIARIGRHRRRHSADFHYDALSYALNFEDDANTGERLADDHRCFSARLPASPPSRESRTPAATTTAAVEIAAIS